MSIPGRIQLEDLPPGLWETVQAPDGPFAGATMRGYRWMMRVIASQRMEAGPLQFSERHLYTAAQCELALEYGWTPDRTGVLRFAKWGRWIPFQYALDEVTIGSRATLINEANVLALADRRLDFVRRLYDTYPNVETPDIMIDCILENSDLELVNLWLEVRPVEVAASDLVAWCIEVGNVDFLGTLLDNDFAVMAQDMYRAADKGDLPSLQVMRGHGTAWPAFFHRYLFSFPGDLPTFMTYMLGEGGLELTQDTFNEVFDELEFENALVLWRMTGEQFELVEDRATIAAWHGYTRKLAWLHARGTPIPGWDVLLMGGRLHVDTAEWVHKNVHPWTGAAQEYALLDGNLPLSSWASVYARPFAE